MKADFNSEIKFPDLIFYFFEMKNRIV
jgi:hypothetical protein